jgi:hypothetical protein
MGREIPARHYGEVVASDTAPGVVSAGRIPRLGQKATRFRV